MTTSQFVTHSVYHSVMTTSTFPRPASFQSCPKQGGWDVETGALLVSSQLTDAVNTSAMALPYSTAQYSVTTHDPKVLFGVLSL